MFPCSDKLDISFYIHWPYCVSKCPYCDFNSHVKQTVTPEQWKDGILKELDFYAGLYSRVNIRTVFFGGGTPSLMDPEYCGVILSKLDNMWGLNGCEVTLEVNPTTSERNKLKNFIDAGINRFSVGVQSFNDATLKFLGRNHSSKESIKTLEDLQYLNVEYSFDLMFGMKNQSLEDWKVELHRAKPYILHHISLYQLTLERGTKFYNLHRAGLITLPGGDTIADFYDYNISYLEKCNLTRYEVSNYAKSSFESQHNLAYWKYLSYLPLGPGAHGRLHVRDRVLAIDLKKTPTLWFDSVNKGGLGVEGVSTLGEREVIIEFLIMGLRLSRGICKKNFLKQTGKLWDSVCDFTGISFLEQQGLVENTKDYFRVTGGYPVLESILRYFDQNIIL